MLKFPFDKLIFAVIDLSKIDTIINFDKKEFGIKFKIVFIANR